MQIYISRDGETKGPYSIEDVNAYLKDGTLSPTDLACQEGMDEWWSHGESNSRPSRCEGEFMSDFTGVLRGFQNCCTVINSTEHL